MTIDNPFSADGLTVAAQIGNVRSELARAIGELAQHGKTEQDAERLLSAGLGRSLLPAWYNAAYSVVSSRKQLIELEATWREEEHAEEQAKRAAALAACPFAVGDKVLHKSGTDASVGGTVKRIYTIEKVVERRWVRVARVSVDWPAPHRIGGDGWHRSDVLATAIIPMTDAEIERRCTARLAKLESLKEAN